jgi:hypothetical protein
MAARTQGAFLTVKLVASSQGSSKASSKSAGVPASNLCTHIGSNGTDTKQLYFCFTSALLLLYERRTCQQPETELLLVYIYIYIYVHIQYIYIYIYIHT